MSKQKKKTTGKTSPKRALLICICVCLAALLVTLIGVTAFLDGSVLGRIGRYDPSKWNGMTE